MNLKNNSPSGELRGLRNVINSIKALTTAFACFQGESAQLVMLLQNIDLIIQKQSCGSGASSGTTGLGSSSLLTENSNSSKIERLRVTLELIKLQLSAFRFFARDSSHLNLYLQNLDLIIAKQTKAQLPSAVSPVKQEGQEEAGSVGPAEVEIIFELKFDANNSNQSGQERKNVSILELTTPKENKFSIQKGKNSGDAQRTDPKDLTDVIVPPTASTVPPCEFPPVILGSCENPNQPGTSAAALAFESRKRSLEDDHVVEDRDQDENLTAPAFVPFAAKKTKTVKDIMSFATARLTRSSTAALATKREPEVARGGEQAEGVSKKCTVQAKKETELANRQFEDLLTENGVQSLLILLLHSVSKGLQSQGLALSSAGLLKEFSDQLAHLNRNGGRSGFIADECRRVGGMCLNANSFREMNDQLNLAIIKDGPQITKKEAVARGKHDCAVCKKSLSRNVFNDHVWQKHLLTVRAWPCPVEGCGRRSLKLCLLKDHLIGVHKWNNLQAQRGMATIKEQVSYRQLRDHNESESEMDRN